jgi:hypothetical protein
MWITNGSTSGAGPHWAISPATSAPAPAPAEKASDERRAPEVPSAAWSNGGCESSLIQLLPAANAIPTVQPDRSRPATRKIAPSGPSASNALPATAAAIPASITGRRPRRSDSGPAISSAGASPSTYTPSSALTISAE